MAFFWERLYLHKKVHCYCRIHKKYEYEFMFTAGLISRKFVWDMSDKTDFSTSKQIFPSRD